VQPFCAIFFEKDAFLKSKCSFKGLTFLSTHWLFMFICATFFVQNFVERMHPLKLSVLLKDLHFFLHIDCLCLFVKSFLCKILLRRMHLLKVNVLLKIYTSFFTLIVYAYLCNPFCVQLYWGGCIF
jgi:hypothetical protein